MKWFLFQQYIFFLLFFFFVFFKCFSIHERKNRYYLHRQIDHFVFWKYVWWYFNKNSIKWSILFSILSSYNSINFSPNSNFRLAWHTLYSIAKFMPDAFGRKDHTIFRSDDIHDTADINIGMVRIVKVHTCRAIWIWTTKKRDKQNN